MYYETLTAKFKREWAPIDDRRKTNLGKSNTSIELMNSHRRETKNRGERSRQIAHRPTELRHVTFI